MRAFASYLYIKLLPYLTPAPKFAQPTLQPIALISDDMTHQNLRQLIPVVPLTPSNFNQVFKLKPKLLFCESAWLGANGSWRGQIYKDNRVFYENRKALIKILEHCNKNAIPTVFWAKEDPTYFAHKTYDFTSTAMLFDHILTTAEECIPKYKALGCENVHLWSFGFSQEYYYLPKDGQRENIAIFAGSWFNDHTQRCEDLTKIFDMVLSHNIPLQIYDRQRINRKSKKPFPQKYQPYVKDSIPYESLGEIYRNAEYVINVNTVTASDTMFSRRVYEAMACGCIIITNESQGLRKQFGNNLWFLGETFDFTKRDKIRQRNAEIVFTNHTNEKRVSQLMEILQGAIL